MPSAQEDLFTGNANRLARFREVRDYLSSLGGNVTVRPAKTQVAFRGKRRQFAWVWLPQPWDKRRHPDSIVVSFALDHEVRDGRIAQAVEPRPGRWMHHVVVLGAEELDQQVKEWLREAHRQASNPS